MAKERIVNVRFWRDNYILGLKPDARLLFLWAITNPATELCGAYEAALATIEVETGLRSKRILEIFGDLERSGKLLYKNGWVVVRNFGKHQHGTSTNIKAAIKRTLNDCPDWVKDTVSNGIDTRSYLDLDSVRQPRPLKVAADAAEKTVEPPSDPVQERIWKDGRDLLTRSGMTDSNAGGFLGLMAKQFGSEPLAEAIASTQAKNAADPKTYIVAVLQKRGTLNGQVGKYNGDEPEYKCQECFDSKTIQTFVPNEGSEFTGVLEESPCPHCASTDATLP